MESMDNKKKVFLVDFSSPILIAVAKKLAKEGQVEISYWTGQKRFFDEVSSSRADFPNTIFHNSLQAVKGIPAKGVDSSKYDPPSADLIDEMLECESLTISMMTRLDWKRISFLKKKHLYYKYLQYWEGVIKEFKPEAIIFRSVPHAAYNFVLYSLAKKYQIKTIMFDTVVFDDCLTVVYDYKNPSEKLLEEYNKIKNEVHLASELGQEREKYYQKLVDPTQDATHWSKTEIDSRIREPIRRVPTLKKIIKNIKSGNFFAVANYHIKSVLNLNKTAIFTIDEEDNSDYRNIYQLKKIEKIANKYINEYKDLQVDVDFDKKYIYFPLHYQPECNTSPMARHFADQILMIKTLSYSIPSDWVIYVKEHTHQWDSRNSQPHLYRYNSYYREIASLPNVYLISPRISSYDLIEKCQAVSTATGTAGWEAVARKKPVLIFGFPWYMYCDGVFQVSSVEECKKAIDKIIDGYLPDPQKVLNYLLALTRISTEGAVMMYMQKSCKFPIETSVQNVTTLINKEIGI